MFYDEENNETSDSQEDEEDLSDLDLDLNKLMDMFDEDEQINIFIY